MINVLYDKDWFLNDPVKLFEQTQPMCFLKIRRVELHFFGIREFETNIAYIVLCGSKIREC